MLNQLTKYLLQYRRVSIPSVGTILLVQQPAVLNVADKIILPPSFTAELRDEDNVPEHQLQFLAGLLNEEKETIYSRLVETGERLGEKVRGEGFTWRGIGTIRQAETPVVLSDNSLQPVIAERVLRQDAEHNVLVGDQQMTSTQISGLREEEHVEEVETKRSIFVIIGWVLLFLSILYIIFVLYQGKFRVGATGSKSAPTGWLHQLPDGRNGGFYFDDKNNIHL